MGKLGRRWEATWSPRQESHAQYDSDLKDVLPILYPHVYPQGFWGYFWRSGLVVDGQGRLSSAYWAGGLLPRDKEHRDAALSVIWPRHRT